ncbi:MAG TPA: hypothetical protein VGF67_06445 [Ktedonobacteraceae bacterium]
MASDDGTGYSAQVGDARAGGRLNVPDGQHGHTRAVGCSLDNCVLPQALFAWGLH